MLHLALTETELGMGLLSLLMVFSAAYSFWQVYQRRKEGPER